MGICAGWMCWLLLLFLLAAVLLFTGLSVTLFTLNIEGREIYKPYVSDRFEIPFPSLFDEFELDGASPLKSSVQKRRGAPETCWRRVAPEYETYISDTGGVFQHVNRKRFVVGADMPPGWLSYTSLDTSVLVILDGCRTDYALYDPGLKPGDSRSVFTNHMPVYHEHLDSPSTRNKSRFFRFVAPTPTFTVYSIKCLYTGETRRSSMVDTAEELHLDNLGAQLFRNGENICTLGDVSSSSFFGPYRLYRDYTGVGTDIYDMEVPDCLVTKHYAECVEACNMSVLHLVAIDHLGHAGKRVSADMTYYMDDYDRLLRKVLDHTSSKPNTMVLVFGDHGQKTNGSHGGATKEEVDSFLFVTSDLDLMKLPSDRCDVSDAPTGYARDHNVLSGRMALSYPVEKSAHINMASTVTLLMNKPVPFHSHGTLIKDVVPLIKDQRGNVNHYLSLKYLTQLLHVVAHQMLRAVDTTVDESDRLKYERPLFAVTRERLVLAHYYAFLRSMGRDEVEPAVMMEVCRAYMAQCDRLIAASRRLFALTNLALTPEYMVSSVLFSAIAWMLSTYLLLAAWRVYHTSTMTESERVLFECSGFASLTNIALRGLAKLFVAAAASAAAMAHMVSFPLVDSSHSPVPQNLPVSVFKRFLGPMERWCGMEEQPPSFYFICYLAFVLLLLFLTDVPFFLRSFRTLYREKKEFDFTLPIGHFDPHLGSLLSKVSIGDPVWAVLLLYVVVVTQTLVSQCAIVSHDRVLLHTIVLALLLVLFPVAKRLGTLRLDGAHRNLAVFCLILKASSFLHYYLLRRDIGGMLPAWYVRVNDVLRTFEPAAAVLTVFYLTLLLLLRAVESPTNPKKTSSPLSELRSSPANSFFLRTVWTVQYLGLLFHYAMKCDRHYVVGPAVTWLSVRLVDARNSTVAKTFLGVLSARCCAAFTVLVWVAFAVNPRQLVYATEDAPNHRSTRLFWCIVNMTWLTLLLNGPKKAVGAYMLACSLFNLSSLLQKLHVRTRTTCTVLFLLTSDLLYFIAGHQDSVFELDFDSAFLFFDSYIGLPCQVAVFFAFAIFHITTICSLIYHFLLQGERNYTTLQQGSPDAVSGTVYDSSAINNTAPAASPTPLQRLDLALSSWVSGDIFKVAAEYTYIVCVQMVFTVAPLFALSGNACALTDFYPKGVFSIGKMVVNLCTIWVLDVRVLPFLVHERNRHERSKGVKRVRTLRRFALDRVRRDPAARRLATFNEPDNLLPPADLTVHAALVEHGERHHEPERVADVLGLADAARHAAARADPLEEPAART
ncbi:GPI ethanolamine phosphate transferase 3 [Babesia caballi]|uniref:GPI ethanolamine phosphate transferase 3 n=1 Tax=Babesia caballi TaxID=5871 RepID=A0AAV4M1I7_BABCB|nr:GPI ethanolamine phosphate transferase 3 [Babesia caballi]